MADKIRVACEARRDPVETLIIARTDARQNEGLEGALQRAEAYSEAGADILFVEALETEAEMREACRRIGKPMLANMADGGQTPIRPASELRDIGYQLAIFPALTGLAAAAAVEAALTALKATGTSQSPDVPLFSFDRFNRLVGFEEVWDFDRRWTRGGEPASGPAERDEARRPAAG